MWPVRMVTTSSPQLWPSTMQRSGGRAREPAEAMLHRFCPRLAVPAVTALSPGFFQSRGLTAALLDLDNTLVAWNESTVDAAVAEWLATLSVAGVRCCL